MIAIGDLSYDSHPGRPCSKRTVAEAERDLRNAQRAVRRARTLESADRAADRVCRLIAELETLRP